MSLAADGRDIALLEVGASAGLNLALDRYRHRLGSQDMGPSAAAVVLQPEAWGQVMPGLSMPRIVARVGLDLDPIDLADHGQRTWLRACVWADQVERLHRLDRAIDVALADPPVVRQGDARTDLAGLAAELPRDVRLVVMHSNTLAYLDQDGRRAVREQVEALAARRDVAWVSAEGPGVLADVFAEPEPRRERGAWGLLGLATWNHGRMVPRTLARFGPHGTWLEWL